MSSQQRFDNAATKLWSFGLRGRKELNFSHKQPKHLRTHIPKITLHGKLSSPSRLVRSSIAGNPTAESGAALSVVKWFDRIFVVVRVFRLMFICQMACGRAAVPSITYCSFELRDGGSDYLGKGVSKAVNNVNSIIVLPIGKDPTDQTGLDNYMVHQLDGTQNEWVVCKVGAAVKNIPLYKEFMILPAASSFKEAMKMGCEVYHHLKKSSTFLLGERNSYDMTFSLIVGANNNFGVWYTVEWLPFTAHIMVFENLENKEGLELPRLPSIKQVVIGMDVAASEFYGKDKTYDLNFKEENNNGSQKISGDQLKDLYKSFVSEYPIVSIEDPFDQDDWETGAKLTAEISQAAWQDVPSLKKMESAKVISGKACNALLLKVNQIGSVTESIEAVKTKQAGWGVMTSQPQVRRSQSSCNRLGRKRKFSCVEFMTLERSLGYLSSGETEDTFIADLAVGLSTGQIKTELHADQNALQQPVLISHSFQQLLRIEEELGADAVYAGASFRTC
ncbi:hypothetical protein HAX54_048250 [Datura stramonium]|uniref:phosphopyruvate hydratase n=1 Tax=Datura stramonium TaxID=4076 RepID=A0ABS8WNT7_DATST|nr:hypothetical protein [Datura stramonium]